MFITERSAIDMSEDNEEIQNGTEEEYAEYWTNKGALKAMNTP